MKEFLRRWLFGAELKELRQLRTETDALMFFAADTCDTVNPLIARVDKLENLKFIPKPMARRLRVKHK